MPGETARAESLLLREKERQLSDGQIMREPPVSPSCGCQWPAQETASEVRDPEAITFTSIRSHDTETAELM